METVIAKSKSSKIIFMLMFILVGLNSTAQKHFSTLSYSSGILNKSTDKWEWTSLAPTNNIITTGPQLFIIDDINRTELRVKKKLDNIVEGTTTTITSIAVDNNGNECILKFLLNSAESHFSFMIIYPNTARLWYVNNNPY